MRRLRCWESLPLGENALYPRRLAITWINRGIVLQKRDAARCFRKAIDVLEQPAAAAVADGPALLAGAWTNLAGVLVGLDEAEAGAARSAANKALALVKKSERDDAVFAEMGLKARHALCRLAVQEVSDKKAMVDETLAEATDAVDEGLALAEHWKFQEQGDFARLAREIFRFGCRIHENREPHFLAEYLMEGLALERFGGAVPLDEATCDGVQAAIWSALDNLQVEGFQFVATPQLEPFLADIEALRKAEERLKALRSQLNAR